ncbi:hypothetical protein HK102_001599, partial [Quaeritorhiza haematococci]
MGISPHEFMVFNNTKGSLLHGDLALQAQQDLTTSTSSSILTPAAEFEVEAIPVSRTMTGSSSFMGISIPRTMTGSSGLSRMSTGSTGSVASNRAKR